MKIDEIKEMEAGRELDALVAEQVMDWERYDWHIWPTVVKTEYCVRCGQTKSKGGPERKGPWCNRDKDAPHYSTNIAAAWKVLEHVTRLPRKPEDHPMPGPAFMYQWEKGPGRELWACSSEEAAAEICKMALTAVLSTKKEV